MDSLPGPPLSIFLISCLSSFLLKTSTPYLTHAYYPFLKDIRSLSLLLDSGTVVHTTFAIVIEKQYLNAHWKYMFEKRLFKNIKIDLLLIILRFATIMHQRDSFSPHISQNVNFLLFIFKHVCFHLCMHCCWLFRQI